MKHRSLFSRRSSALWKRFALLSLCLLLPLGVCGCAAKGEPNEPAAPESDVQLSDDASDFVLISEAVPDAILEIRYFSTYNFVGDRIDGYEEPIALLTKEAAAALKTVSDELVEKGYRLKIFDAYRPQKAVSHFVRWAQDADDVRMKEYFYPDPTSNTKTGCSCARRCSATASSRSPRNGGTSPSWTNRIRKRTSPSP